NRGGYEIIVIPYGITGCRQFVTDTLFVAAPFHGTVDLGDHAAPGDRGLLRTDLAESAFGEHAAYPTVYNDAQCFVDVVQRRTRSESVDDRREPQRVSQIPADLGGFDE